MISFMLACVNMCYSPPAPEHPRGGAGSGPTTISLNGGAGRGPVWFLQSLTLFSTDKNNGKFRLVLSEQESERGEEDLELETRLKKDTAVPLFPPRMEILSFHLVYL